MKARSGGWTPARIMLPLGIGTAFSLLGDSTMYTVLPLQTEAAGISIAAVGILLGVNRIVRIVSNSVSGHLFDRGSKRRLFLVSILMGALSTFGYALGRGFWPLLAARAVWGLAWSGISIGGVSILLAVTGPQDRGRWLGVHQLWFLIGTAAGSVLGGAQTDLLGYRGAMAANGALTLLSLFVVFYLLPEVGAPPPEEGDPAVPAARRWDGGLYLAAATLGLSRLVLAGILAALISLIAREKLAPHFVILGVSTLTGMLSAARTAVSMASAPAAGLISDALKDRWSALAASLGFGCVGLSLLALDSPLPLILGLLLCAVPAGGVAVLTRILVGELSHRSIQGRAMGIVQTVGDLGSAIGPPLAFLVLPAAGLALIFRLSSAAFALNLLVILLMRRGLIARAGRFAG